MAENKMNQKNAKHTKKKIYYLQIKNNNLMATFTTEIIEAITQ